MNKPSKTKNNKIFDMDGKSILLEEKDLGIFNGMITANVPYTQALAVKGMWAPPYVSSDFLCEIRLFGESVKSNTYTWSPREVNRRGHIKGINVESVLILAESCRGAIFSFELTNTTNAKITVPLSLHLLGTFAYNKVWNFYKQLSEPAFTDPYNYARRFDFSAKNRTIVCSNDAGGIVLQTDVAGLKKDGYSPCCNTSLSLQAKQSKSFYVCFGMGKVADSVKICKRLALNPEREIQLSRKQYSESINKIFSKLPQFHAQDKKLEQFYNRSLIPFVLNVWHVPEFLLDPYYSTGGINGGCVCCYLWDLGEGWEILNLYDPKTMIEHVKVFLKMGLGNHFAFLPLTGEGYGPWYPVNQEKIIFIVYYYLLFTGDKSLLLQKDGGKTVLDQLIEQALHGDDIKKSVSLIDYGKGNNHLELRRQYHYDNYLPDLNARRYANYKAVATMCKMVGKDGSYLEERAEQIKNLVLKKMWSRKHKWFYHFDEKWKKDIRYTVQMFKLLGSDVLDKEQIKGLLSHLNEKEFISEYGLHSMSKQDIAFDQVDIDNGGGGIYTGFSPQIIERLYKIGKFKEAENILKKILWWGQRSPYWGDSFVSNFIDYRHDTSLQNTLGALPGAQSIIFGIFGVKVDVNGTITINPVPPAFSPNISLKNLKIRGKCIDILVNKNNYTVKCADKKIKSKIGKAITI